MVFSSAVFLFVFLSVVFGLCLLPVPLKIKNVILIIASIVFYAYGEPVYVLMMLASSIVNYIFGRLLGRISFKPEEVNIYGPAPYKTRGRKLILFFAVFFNIGILGVVKYTDFVLGNINSIFGSDIPLPGIALPIGISFFTFQALSYVIDAYRDPSLSQKSYPAVLLYISLFPQLVAGPIVKYKDIEDQIYNRKMTLDGEVDGIRRFSKGLFKKIFIANIMGGIADHIFMLDTGCFNAACAWLGAVTYTLQIYYDFSAYSDMALGLGKMFGFDFKENFNHPYCSVGIHDFWDRWHMSLSTWFKEYVYIPLGGNRKGKFRCELNKLIVFLLTGIWHGANWTFILWGMIHGVANVIEDTILPLGKIKIRALGNVITLLIVTLAFVFFRADNISYGLDYIKVMFTGFNTDSLAQGIFAEQMTVYNMITIVVAVIFSYPLLEKAEKKLSAKMGDKKTYLYCPLSLMMLILSILRISSGAYNPFIYFNF